jgi:hypothetical protein
MKVVKKGNKSVELLEEMSADSLAQGLADTLDVMKVVQMAKSMVENWAATWE